MNMCFESENSESMGSETHSQHLFLGFQ